MTHFLRSQIFKNLTIYMNSVCLSTATYAYIGQVTKLSSRGAVSSSSIASMELQTFVEPLLLCYTPSTVQTWPTAAREEILAVAHRDLAVARRNIANFTHYLDIHAVHLAACAGALDDTVPLMSAETFPQLPGGIQSALREIKRDQ